MAWAIPVRVSGFTTAIVGLLSVSLMVVGCGQESVGGTTSQGGPTAAEPVSLTVFAAASLTGSFQELGLGFEAAHPGVSVTFNFAGSQILRTQIEEGATADVFASASQEEMGQVESAGDLLAPARSFATNLLTVIVAPGNPGDIVTAQDLASPGVKLVLAAEEVPVGAYARQALAKLAEVYGTPFLEHALQNVVSNEDNVKQVVAKVQLGEADAGIVYATDAAASGGLETVALPEAQNIVAEYPIAVLGGSRNVRLALEFVEYVLSPEGQGVLHRWGFGPPP